MHELAICQALLDQVVAIAAQRAARVSSVTLRIGPLSGVAPRLLAEAYPLACAGSLAAGSRLTIEVAPVRVRCRQCGAESPAQPNRLVCGACRAWQTDLVCGDELLLLRVTLDQTQEEACDV